MNYAQALKEIQAEKKKAKDNYLVFEFSYDVKILLPHKDGLVLIGALSNAEELQVPYNEKHSITEMRRDKIKISQMSQEEYERYKLSALLGITIDEAQELQKTTAN